MKYMIMLYGTQQDHDALAGRPTAERPWTPDEAAALYEHMGKLNAELAESGELVSAYGLAEPVHTRRIALRDGAPVVTDGPYAETLEVLAGYTIVDCADFDRATEIGLKFAAAPGPEGVAERAFLDIRPLDGSDTEG